MQRWLLFLQETGTRIPEYKFHCISICYQNSKYLIDIPFKNIYFIRRKCTFNIYWREEKLNPWFDSFKLFSWHSSFPKIMLKESEGSKYSKLFYFKLQISCIHWRCNVIDTNLNRENMTSFPSDWAFLSGLDTLIDLKDCFFRWT